MFPALVRLAVAATCGAIIGLFFELHDRPGGIRTHMMTTLGAMFFCATSASITKAPAEVLRVVQGIASGVGFIGGAAVLRTEGRVKGITNAASLWISAAIGCEAALGDVRMALSAAVFVAVLNDVVHRIERRFLKKRKAPHV
jgi:putative Mg2+ transporter-C (MgtC) family protein